MQFTKAAVLQLFLVLPIVFGAALPEIQTSLQDEPNTIFIPEECTSSCQPLAHLTNDCTSIPLQTLEPCISCLRSSDNNQAQSVAQALARACEPLTSTPTSEESDTESDITSTPVQLVRRESPVAPWGGDIVSTSTTSGALHTTSMPSLLLPTLIILSSILLIR